MAAEKVHPVPCTFGVSIHGARRSVTDRPSKATSTDSASAPVPSLHDHEPRPERVELTGGRLHGREVGDAGARSAGRPPAGSASRRRHGREGHGRRPRRPRRRRAGRPTSSRARGRPRVAEAVLRRPGPRAASRCRPWPASRSSRRVPARSSRTASSCAATIAGLMARTSPTPTVFWAVTVVTTSVPNTPWAAKVRRSAATPAPPPESVPAIVRATFGVGVIARRRRLRRPAAGRGGTAPSGGGGPPRSRTRPKPRRDAPRRRSYGEIVLISLPVFATAARAAVTLDACTPRALWG